MRGVRGVRTVVYETDDSVEIDVGIVVASIADLVLVEVVLLGICAGTAIIRAFAPKAEHGAGTLRHADLAVGSAGIANAIVIIVRVTSITGAVGVGVEVTRAAACRCTP